MFKKAKRKNSFTRNNSPKVSIRRHHLGFNAIFVEKAGISKFTKVEISVDEENFKIGFRFHNTDDPDSWTLFSDNKSNRTRAISAEQLKKDYPFINEISNFGNPTDRQFEVKRDTRDKHFWVATLCPAFESKVSSNSKLKESQGIYRYKRSKGEVVYIGKGKILSRLNSQAREEWDFDVIEYSIISDSEAQSQWESYYLNKFVNENGKLPFYNKIKGKKE